MMKPYVHTQVGSVLLAIYGVVIPIVVYLVGVTGFALLPLAALILVVLAAVAFATLRVSVDDRIILIRFGPGVFSRAFSLGDIDTHEVVRNRWYYGLGIRYIPGGWLFAVSGLSAVELQMKNGKRYRIGTDDPEGLSDAITKALRGSRG